MILQIWRSHICAALKPSSSCCLFNRKWLCLFPHFPREWYCKYDEVIFVQRLNQVHPAAFSIANDYACSGFSNPNVSVWMPPNSPEPGMIIISFLSCPVKLQLKVKSPFSLKSCCPHMRLFFLYTYRKSVFITVFRSTAPLFFDSFFIPAPRALSYNTITYPFCQHLFSLFLITVNCKLK